jgi:hypothetical protein
MKLHLSMTLALVLPTEAALLEFQEELQKKEWDTLKTEDHHLTVIPTRSLKSWSKHVAWTNKQASDLKHTFFVITFQIILTRTSYWTNHSYTHYFNVPQLWKTTSKQIVPYCSTIFKM